MLWSLHVTPNMQQVTESAVLDRQCYAPATDRIFKVKSFFTRLLFSCTDEYEHTYDIFTYWVSSDRVSQG